MKNFRTYQLAVQFYKDCSSLKLPKRLRDQLSRASSSIVLNLAEGSVKPTRRDQMRFFFIAFGSLRECQAVLDLCDNVSEGMIDLADHIGASLHKLTR